LGFIDQLLADKKELNDQIENLMAQLKHSESNSNDRIRELEEKWARELKKNKEAWVAAEKVRKEKWMAEKVGEIKNMTIKGLEPEIERIIAKNKVDFQFSAKEKKFFFVSFKL
jgi:5-azacytidine-induced protein 1